MRILAKLLIFLVLPGSAAFASDTVTLSLHTENGQSPAVLEIGQPTTIWVDLAGVVPGTSLDSLAATVKFSGSLVSAPSIQAATVLPANLDNPLDLLTTSDFGLADVAYLTFSTNSVHHIQTNGSFFSFSVIGTQAGSSAFHFDFVGATKFNAANPNAPSAITAIAGADLPFTVMQVPEPDTMALLLIAVLTLGWYRKG